MQMGAGSPKASRPHGCPGCDGATPYFPSLRAVVFLDGALPGIRLNLRPKLATETGARM